MNLYEFEGKQLFAKHGLATPKGVVVRRGENFAKAYNDLGIKSVVVKAQVLSGQRGKNQGIKFCSSADEVVQACAELFRENLAIASAPQTTATPPTPPLVRGGSQTGQYVAAVLIEEKLDIAEEHYLSITYDTNKKQPLLIYSTQGGVDIEDVPDHYLRKDWLDVRETTPYSPPSPGGDTAGGRVGQLPLPYEGGGRGWLSVAQALWSCFLAEDARLVEINPLVKTRGGRWVAADAKIAIDDDAFYRHEEWKALEPRTMLGRLPTEREVAVTKIDEGEAYYRGTAGKYIEMPASPASPAGGPAGGDGDIAILFSGGGASIANMDALIRAGLRPANYTEYSGNPPREKVYSLAKIVLSKPGLKGLWIAGGVANFTNIAETLHGIVDALDEIKPTYPIVVRRAGPYEEEGMRLMRECAARNNLNMKLFGKETSMSETAKVLAQMVQGGEAGTASPRRQTWLVPALIMAAGLILFALIGRSTLSPDASKPEAPVAALSAVGVGAEAPLALSLTHKVNGRSAEFTWITNRSPIWDQDNVPSWRLLRGSRENPEYGKTFWYRFVTKYNFATISNLPAGTHHFRVCIFDGWDKGKCTLYSNNVVVTIAP